jgi:cytosine/adenosine deaminase-related metal-dependent hydrolase
MNHRKVVLFARSIEEWLDRNYKPERLHSDPEKRARVIADCEKELAKNGYTWFSRHEANSGVAECLFRDSSGVPGYAQGRDNYTKLLQPGPVSDHVAALQAVIDRLRSEPSTAEEWTIIARHCEQVARAARKSAKDAAR